MQITHAKDQSPSPKHRPLQGAAVPSPHAHDEVFRAVLPLLSRRGGEEEHLPHGARKIAEFTQLDALECFSKGFKHFSDSTGNAQHFRR